MSTNEPNTVGPCAGVEQHRSGDRIRAHAHPAANEEDKIAWGYTPLRLFYGSPIEGVH
jgi:hypothetical protein